MFDYHATEANELIALETWCQVSTSTKPLDEASHSFDNVLNFDDEQLTFQ